MIRRTSGVLCGSVGTRSAQNYKWDWSVTALCGDMNSPLQVGRRWTDCGGQIAGTSSGAHRFLQPEGGRCQGSGQWSSVRVETAYARAQSVRTHSPSLFAMRHGPRLVAGLRPCRRVSHVGNSEQQPAGNSATWNGLTTVPRTGPRVLLSGHCRRPTARPEKLVLAA